MMTARNIGNADAKSAEKYTYPIIEAMFVIIATMRKGINALPFYFGAKT